MNMNKKWITTLVGILSSGFLCAENSFKLPALSLDTSCRFDTEHVYRGSKLNQQTFIPKIEISASLFGSGDIYFGTKAFLSTKNSRFDKYDLYIGLSYDIADTFALDAGFTHHVYRNRFSWIPSIKPYWKFVKRHSEEIYIGCIADVLLSPSLYYYYDITLKRHNLEGRMSYRYDLSSWGIGGFAMDLFAKVGYDRTQQPFGLKGSFKDGAAFAGSKKGYCYYGSGADLIYTVNEHAAVRAGVKYEGANGKKAWIAKISEKYRKNLLWFSSSIESSF
jgi:hypothetical protein